MASLQEARLSQIEELYSSMSIYRSLIVYDDDNEFIALKKAMLLRDYTFTEDPETRRIYTLKVSDSDHDKIDTSIDWKTVSLVICLSDECMEYVKKLYSMLNITKMTVIVKI
jgi:hypothetical protein